ncbi:MAG: tetratricopeptide repeat protein, partial [Cyanobacteriota bacterium]|nr:tetratricopeptide repeat protein [Cyanobacteriota bacterium]
EAYFIRAYAKNNLGDPQGAIADYSEAIKLNPKLANAYLNRGTIRLYGIRDYSGAIEDFTKSIAMNPPSQILLKAISSRAQAKIYMQDLSGMCEDQRLGYKLVNSSPDLKHLKNDINYNKSIKEVLSFCPKS